MRTKSIRLHGLNTGQGPQHFLLTFNCSRPPVPAKFSLSDSFSLLASPPRLRIIIPFIYNPDKPTTLTHFRLPSRSNLTGHYPGVDAQSKAVNQEAFFSGMGLTLGRKSPLLASLGISLVKEVFHEAAFEQMIYFFSI